jgi:hypothetical protein
MDLTNKDNRVNIIKGKITCGIHKEVMYQKVNSDKKINLFYCKKKNCKNSINRKWLYEMIRLAVNEHHNKDLERNYLNDEINNLDREIELALKRIKFKKAHLERAFRDKFEVIGSLGEKEFNAIIKQYRNEKKELEKVYSDLKTKRDNKFEGFKQLGKPFSKNLSKFKEQIKHIVEEVIISKEEAIINILGWRKYYIKKPNSSLFGWSNRKENSKPYIYELPPCIYDSGDEHFDAEMYVQTGRVSDDEIDKYFKSEEYLEKTKNVKGLGSKSN